MPHIVDVRCHNCGSRALFEFAELVKISERKDVPFFQQGDQFEYLLCKDSCGHRWHGAAFFAGLHGRTVNSIRELPDGYQSSDWQHSRYLYRSSGLDIGSINCPTCHFRSKHTLKWPADAYYQVEYKGKVLWAFHEESARELLQFIVSPDRDRKKYKWCSFLMKVPTFFLKKGARLEVMKKLRRLLDEDTGIEQRH
jgi:hypothetical protein